MRGPVHPPYEEGMDPVRALSAMRRSIMLAGSEGGSTPLSMLPPRSRYARFGSLPRDWGTGPDRPLRKPTCAPQDIAQHETHAHAYAHIVRQS